MNLWYNHHVCDYFTLLPEAVPFPLTPSSELYSGEVMTTQLLVARVLDDLNCTTMSQQPVMKTIPRVEQMVNQTGRVVQEVWTLIRVFPVCTYITQHQLSASILSINIEDQYWASILSMNIEHIWWPHTIQESTYKFQITEQSTNAVCKPRWE